MFDEAKNLKLHGILEIEVSKNVITLWFKNDATQHYTLLGHYIEGVNKCKFIPSTFIESINKFRRSLTRKFDKEDIINISHLF